jgi:hypothetical protein
MAADDILDRAGTPPPTAAATSRIA